MQILTRMKKQCDKCKDAKYISELYFSNTIEYVCPACNGSGYKHVKRWVTLESLLKKGKK